MSLKKHSHGGKKDRSRATFWRGCQLMKRTRVGRQRTEQSIAQTNVERLELVRDDLPGKPCSEKFRYTTYEDAQRMMEEMKKYPTTHGPQYLNVYECVECGQYHIGHSKPRWI